MPKANLTLEDIEQIKNPKVSYLHQRCKESIILVGVDYKNYGIINLLHKTLKILKKNNSLHYLHSKI